MAWAACDRAAPLAAAVDGGHDLSVRWRRVAGEIHEDVCRRGFDPNLGSFVQSYGSKALDASLLHIPVVGFLPPDDPRVLGTVDAIERGLMRDGFLLRYETAQVADGLPAGERTSVGWGKRVAVRVDIGGC